MANYEFGRRALSRELREKILETYLADHEAGTRLAMGYGLSAAYAYRLAHERGLVPRSRKEWGQLREAP